MSRNKTNEMPGEVNLSRGAGKNGAGDFQKHSEKSSHTKC